jgi:hypothetical protein
LIGSSVALGERVPFLQTLAALLPKKLAQQSGAKIELYNEGMAYGFARNTALRFQDALAANPDMILWVLTPLDIGRAGFDYTKPSPMHIVADRKLDVAKNVIRRYVREYVGGIVSRYALRHWMYEIQSQNQYVQSYLLNSPQDREAGFLKAQFSPEWQADLSEFWRICRRHLNTGKSCGYSPRRNVCAKSPAGRHGLPRRVAFRI